MTLHVEMVVPEGEIWTGSAQRVIAKTMEGNIGVLTGHSPVLGILAEGSVVRILPEDENTAQVGTEVLAAVGGGFLSVADDRVSILARQAELGSQVDKAAARAAIDAAEPAGPGRGGEEPAAVRYAKALLVAAGDQA